MTASAAPSPALVTALRRALRPLVRLMVAQGLTFPYLAELLKKLFVEVADVDCRADAKPPTDSCVSLATGIHRKEVSRLRSALAVSATTLPAVLSLGAQVAAVWLGTSRYLDEAGHPLPLPRLISEGGELSFAALVAGVNSDIRSRAVLDELLRLGVARFDEQQRVCLNFDAIVPLAGFEEKALELGNNLHDHAAAAVHNLLEKQPPLIERSVRHDALSARSTRKLAKQAQEMGLKTLLALNKSALSAAQQDAADHGPRQRLTIGVYFYAEACEEKAPGAEPPGDKTADPA